MTTVTRRHAGPAPADETAAQPDAPAAPVKAAVPAVGEADSVTDARGRRIDLKAPSVLQQTRLMRIFGGYNDRAYGQVVTVAFVTAIDEVAVAMPMTEREYEALVQRLGIDGLRVLDEWFTARAEAAQAAGGVDNKETIKN